MSSALPKQARSSRPVRASSQNLRYSEGTGRESNGVNGFAREEQYYSGSEGTPAPRVDLTKLKVQALRKYAKAYEIPFHPSTAKEELASMVNSHWQKMVVSEEQVLQNLLRVRGRH